MLIVVELVSEIIMRFKSLMALDCVNIVVVLDVCELHSVFCS